MLQNPHLLTAPPTVLPDPMLKRTHEAPHPTHYQAYVPPFKRTRYVPAPPCAQPTYLESVDMRGMETNPESRIARLPSFSSLSRRARISGQNFGDRDTGNIIWTDGLLILGMRRILYSITRRPIHIAEGYIEHLVCATNCAAATYLVMMEYVRRATCAARQLGMIDVCDDWEGLLVTGLVLAGKFLDDEVFTNGYYADVGNVPLSVINHLEVRMLGLLDWNLCMSIPRFAECEREMASACVWR